MTQSDDFLANHIVDGTADQIKDVRKYINAATDAEVIEHDIRGFEVFEFTDGSCLARVDDIVFICLSVGELYN